MMGHHHGTREHVCKQAREIFTNQIQSKTQQPDKILNHRDLWIDWRFDWDGIRPRKIYIYWCIGIARDTMLCMKKPCCERMC